MNKVKGHGPVISLTSAKSDKSGGNLLYELTPQTPDY